MILVYGGIGSGKSEYAESLVSRYNCKKAYLATMQVYDEEGRQKVIKHRKMREGKFDRSIEQAVNICDIEVSKDEIVLLECLSNLVANEMFKPDKIEGVTYVTDKIVKDIRELSYKLKELIIVGNDISSDKSEYGLETRNYMYALNKIQHEIEREAGEVIEVIYGLAYKKK